MADDYGRGKVVFPLIRFKMFSTVSSLLTKIKDEEIDEWLRFYERLNVIKIYEVDGETYYCFTKWGVYQRGNWRPAKSNIPPPPFEEATKEEAVEHLERKAEKRSSKIQEILDSAALSKEEKKKRLKDLLKKQ